MAFSLYFDPGTGALIVQFLAAAVAGIVLFYRTIVNKIKAIFGIRQNHADDLPDNEEPKDDN